MSGNGIIAGTLPSAPITAAEMSDWRWQSIGDYTYATPPPAGANPSSAVTQPKTTSGADSSLGWESP